MKWLPVVGLALIACASEPPASASSPRTWAPIPGVASVPFARAVAACRPLLVQPYSGSVDVAQVFVDHRGCMARYGWQEAEAEGAVAETVRQDWEHLQEQVREASTKTALTQVVGGTPTCQDGGPATEICDWEIPWTSRGTLESGRAQMVCVLPTDGRPRQTDSCSVVAPLP